MNQATTTASFVRAMPKVELHLHIEGTLEPELMFELARRNAVTLPWPDIEQLRAAYDFRDLQSFLDVYYCGAQVLLQPRDFDDLAWSWCRRAAADGVVHAEIFVDPQTHTDRGVALEAVLEGLGEALARAERELGMTTAIIPCFLRHLPPEAAAACYRDCARFGDRFVGFGLDSSERDHPPAAFAEVFARVRADGHRVVAHAGEEGPPSYIEQALDILGASRIDHGVRCLEDPALVQRLADAAVPLTVCPLSNLRLRVVDRLEAHPLARMLAAGLCASVHSDDPAYFGGTIATNFEAVTAALALDRNQLRALADNAVAAAFVDATRRAALADAVARHFDADPLTT